MAILLMACVGLSRAAGAQAPPVSSPAVTTTPQLRTQETIDVTRIIIDAHVSDSSSNIITELGPDDFRVRVDGKEAQIESVDWVDELPAEEVVMDEDDREVSRTVIPAPGRLFICFVQTDFARNTPRVVGEMGVIASFHHFVEVLQPEDRVALLSFDSHLKLRLDFTADRQQLEETFPSVLLIDEPPPPPAVALPSLARLLDAQQMKNAGSSEKALILLARALRKINGPKYMILFGWGLGEPVGGHAVVSPEIVRGAAELAAARITVYTFNFGLGGQMRLGLQKVSADTGGFYRGAPVAVAFSGMEFGFLPQLKAELQGHYEIEVRNPVPSVPGKLHHIEVRANRKGLTVRAKNSFVDQP
jgi:VWFA-related protein